ncbi:MAG TPA: dienelactone hydrolase [Deltaproteobacteria bacterium]|nr:dienelactone hydrolase [Deltaproteobacteria bacterium]
MVSEEYVFVPVMKDKKVSGIVSIPDDFEYGVSPAVIIAHGAGNGMFHPLLAHMANVLAATGYLCMRFNFLYRDEDRKSPDGDGVLEATWMHVHQFLRDHPIYKPSSIVAAGKSLGGRIAVQTAAEGYMDIRGIIFLGYPLHAPGRKQNLQDTHLYRLRVPMLFFAGSNDVFCDIEELQGVLAKIDAPCILEVIEGGDHSFKLSASSGISEKQVYAKILGSTLSWLKTV